MGVGGHRFLNRREISSYVLFLADAHQKNEEPRNSTESKTKHVVPFPEKLARVSV